MKKVFFWAAPAALCLGMAPSVFGSIDEQLTLTANGVTATVTVDNLGNLTVSCSAAGQCGNVATTAFSDGVDGTISLFSSQFQGFRVSDTAVGAADNTLPTLQDLNQISANRTNGGPATLTVTFTDVGYTGMSGILNIADSIVNDVSIASSTVNFSVYTSGTNQIGGGNQLSSVTLTGHSASDGANGINVANPNANGSLTSSTVLSFTNNGTIQANMTVANVATPEPGSLALLGSAVAGLGLLLRRRGR